MELLSPHKKLHIGQSTQRSYREIGSLVIGLQGEDRAKYGAEIIKSWQKNYRLNMEEVIQIRICRIFSRADPWRYCVKFDSVSDG